MDSKYMCYCGLYCENCATKARVEPAAVRLYDEMRKAGFEDVVHYLPDGEAFLSFLKSMAEEGACQSCREGSGDPGCEIRICAKSRGVEMCALCHSYPCGLFDGLIAGYPELGEDNALLRGEGMEAWSRLQDKRKADGFTYSQSK